MATTSTRERSGSGQTRNREVVDLMEEVDRYRTACEDALQQLDWCIGYFTGCNKTGVAKALSANRATIRRHLMRRDDQALPTDTKES